MKFTIGIYCLEPNVNIESYSFDDSCLLFKNPIYQLAKNNPNIEYFSGDELNSWRSIYMDDKEGEIGYLVYENTSKAYLCERLVIDKLVNTNIISILDLQKNKDNNLF